MAGERKKATRFPTTRWSLVGRAGASDDLTRQQALTELLAAYLPGLRAYLVETRRIPADITDDLLQGFVADKVLAAGLVRHADQGRGKFRNFILKSLSNYVATRIRREASTHGRAKALDERLIAAAAENDDVDAFEQQWVQQVVHDALRSMEADRRQCDRADMWEIFRLRVVEPALNDAQPIDYEQLVERFGLRLPRQAMNLLANAKRLFERHLRTAVSRYVSDDTEVQKEIADLREIVGR